MPSDTPDPIREEATQQWEIGIYRLVRMLEVGIPDMTKSIALAHDVWADVVVREVEAALRAERKRALLEAIELVANAWPQGRISAALERLLALAEEAPDGE